MSRAARTIVRRHVERTELVVQGLEREIAETVAFAPGEQESKARQLQRAYVAWAQAAAAAAPFYREHSASRAFAESTAFALNRIADSMQREIDIVWGGA